MDRDCLTGRVRCQTLNSRKVFELREVSGFSFLREMAVRKGELEVGGLCRWPGGGREWKKQAFRSPVPEGRALFRVSVGKAGGGSGEGWDLDLPRGRRARGLLPVQEAHRFCSRLNFILQSYSITTLLEMS